jgi:hypothetical protein
MDALHSNLVHLQRSNQAEMSALQKPTCPICAASSSLSPLGRLEASHSSCRIPGKTRKRQPQFGWGRGNLAVTREDLIKHLFEVDSVAMRLDELRSNNWHHISQRITAKGIKSPNLLSLAEVEIDRGAALSPIAQESAFVSVDGKGRQFRSDV